MKRSIHQRLFALLLFALILAGCGASIPVLDSAGTQTTTNADDVAAIVQAEVETQLAAQGQIVPVANNLQAGLGLEEVVGVNSAIASTTRTGSGVGFSVPVAAVQQIVPSLIASGTYDYAYIGASFDSEVSLNEQSIYGLPQNQGAYVVNVTPESPAAEAGLIAANQNSGRGGDLIIAINGQAIADFADLNSYLVFHTQVGQTIQLTVLRDGTTITLPLTLGQRL